MTPYLIAGTAAVSLAAGVWLGYQTGAGQYKVGFAEGVRSQQKLSDAEMRRVLAEARETAAKAREDGARQALEQERADRDRVQRAAEESVRDAQELATAVSALRRRLRLAESTSAAAGGGSGLPAPAGPAVVPEPADTQWLLPEAGRDAIARLAEGAEWESQRYGRCYRWVYSDQVRTK